MNMGRTIINTAQEDWTADILERTNNITVDTWLQFPIWMKSKNRVWMGQM